MRLACPPWRHQLTDMSNPRSTNLAVEDDLAAMAERAVLRLQLEQDLGRSQRRIFGIVTHKENRQCVSERSSRGDLERRTFPERLDRALD